MSFTLVGSSFANKWLVVPDTLAYYDMATIMAVKSFMEQDPDFTNKH
jgi:hypothetical protein